MKQAVDQIVTDYGLVLRAPEWTLVLAEDRVFAASIEGVLSSFSVQVLTHAGEEYVTGHDYTHRIRLDLRSYTGQEEGPAFEQHTG